MDTLEAIEKRHSVRDYDDKPIGKDTVDKLQKVIDKVNSESGLHIQLVLDEPEAFNEEHLSYGRIHGAKNYIALIGPDDQDLEEKCGFYGEKVLLEAVKLGLDTCWVGSTYKKMASVVDIKKGERFLLIIAIGYGLNDGEPHKSKSLDDTLISDGEKPDWFIKGGEAALLAPTAMNQQKFQFILHDDNKVEAKTYRAYFCKTDLGIAKYHFEVGAGKDNFEWK